MPTFFCNDYPRFEMPDLASLVEHPGLKLEGTTLGDLLVNVEAATGLHIVPHDPPKFFRYYKTRGSPNYVLVDIHIEREGASTCPKQDLSFPLHSTDVVEAGVLIC